MGGVFACLTAGLANAPKELFPQNEAGAEDRDEEEKDQAAGTFLEEKDYGDSEKEKHKGDFQGGGQNSSAFPNREVAIESTLGENNGGEKAHHKCVR